MLNTYNINNYDCNNSYDPQVLAKIGSSAAEQNNNPTFTAFKSPSTKDYYFYQRSFLKLCQNWSKLQFLATIVLKDAEKTHDFTSAAKISFDLAESSWHLNNGEQMRNALEMCKNYSEKADHLYTALKIFVFRARIFTAQMSQSNEQEKEGLNKAAKESLLAALEMIAKNPVLQNRKMHAHVLYRLGLLFPEKSLDFFSQSIEIFELIDIQSDLSTYFIVKIEYIKALLKQRQYKKAFRCFNNTYRQVLDLHELLEDEILNLYAQSARNLEQLKKEINKSLPSI